MEGHSKPPGLGANALCPERPTHPRDLTQFASSISQGEVQLKLRATVFILHLLQPTARLFGRIQHGLGPWRRRARPRAAPLPVQRTVWCERWAPAEARLLEIENLLHEAGAVATRGGAFDRWDIAIRGGLFGAARALAMVEEHGAGKQLLRLRAWPKVPNVILALGLGLLITALLAGLDQAWPTTFAVVLAASAILLRACADCVHAMQEWMNAVDAYTGVER
jgi:O-antigen biosynthesis protein